MQSNLPAKADDRTMEFVPYGAEDKIKLNIGIIQKLVAVKTKSGATCSESDAIKFMMMCSARRLNPFEGDAFLIGFDGKDGPQFSLITAHQAFLKRAELNAEYDGMKSGIIVQEDGGGVIDLEGDFFMEGQKLLGGWATVFFKNRKQPMTKRVRLKTFQKPWGIWQENPAGMICKCFDAQTEILTDRGFEKFSNAEGRILQVTEQGLEITDAVPFSRPYTGEMVEFISRNGGFLVTPNHDLPLAVNGDMETKVEARHLLNAKQRDVILMPMAGQFERADFPIPDQWIILAAAYLSDGSDNSASSGFSIAVSRERKVETLRQLSLHRSESNKMDAGQIAIGLSGREIKTLTDKRAFYYSRSAELDWLVSRSKIVNIPNLMALSRRQARLFVTSWMSFDGQRIKTMRLGRIFTSRQDHCAALEISTALAGLSISERNMRLSDLSNRPGIYFTITDRNRVRLTQQYIRRTPNPTNLVWCVTVPTGKIIVRRNGFSAVCHQCAEADALRSSFPTMLGGLYLREELPATAQEPKVATPIFTPTNGVAEPKAIPQSDGIVKQVRDLCDRDKIRESELLFFIGEVFDGVESLGSLEEVHLAQEKTLPMVVEQWSDISKRIIDNRNQK